MNELRENFANDSGLQFTLRQMRRDLANWRVHGLLLILAAVLAWSGPFDTQSAFSLAGRFAFWAATTFLTYWAAHFFAKWTRFHLRARRAPRHYALVAVILVAGLAATIAVLPVTIAVEGLAALAPSAIAATATHAFIIATAAVAAMELLARDKPAEAGEPQRPEPPRLLTRLPVERRGPLISLSVSDHYVEVTTGAGRHMLLIRLKDAIDETAPVNGLQIHRSHWVALEAVSAVRRENGKVFVETTAGDRLPVSRSCLDDLRRAGLLPR
ncbi:LytTR family DNA-binding domain-containing protein [Martelella sp. AMO21009]